MSGWTEKYQDNEPHSFQLHLYNYRADAPPGQQHDGCVVEMWNPVRFYPMTAKGTFMLGEKNPLTDECSTHGLFQAMRMVELVHEAQEQGMTNRESIEYACQVVGVNQDTGE